MFGSTYEMVYSKARHRREILRHKWAGIFGLETQDIKARVHPNQKPIQLIEDLISRHTQPGDLIADFYVGSGTAIIAAQNLSRVCYSSEMVTAYVAITLERYSKHTGERPDLIVA